jgi:hypothetical protein
MPTASKSPAHTKVMHGLCPICKHYGDDCTSLPANTAAPWHIARQSPNSPISIRQLPGRVICDIDGADPEAVANARLIAAAPAQNDALNAISNDCEAWLNEQMDMPAEDLLAAIKSAADSAIAKAA